MGFLGFFCVSSSVWMAVSGEVLEEMETGVVEAEQGVEMQMQASPPTKNGREERRSEHGRPSWPNG